jgi:ribosomal protein S18 acetylase RimI-like enzyme
MPPYPVPVLRVARLAVDEAARRRGVGRALLRFGIELAERMATEFGCVGLEVDAKKGAEDFYRRSASNP